jgi:XTP/dITP diphosphohydrolase
MKRIVLATRNKGKIREINSLFADSGILFSGLDTYQDMPDVIEDGTTFHENAFKKAKEVFNYTGMISVSEDSGLAVDALGGAPGIYSSRFASESASDRENIEKLIEELNGVSYEKRTARFVSVFCLHDGKETWYFEGHVEGHIIDEPRGESGFGYDPLFVPGGYDKTFAELGADIKNSISHRAMAIAKLKEFLHQKS